MKKQFILLITVLSLFTTAIPTYASTADALNGTNKTTTSTATTSTDKEKFLSSDVAKAFHAKELKTLPKDAKVLKFDTWDEALNFSKTQKANLDSSFIKNTKSSSSKTNLLAESDSPVDELDTDYYSIGYVNFNESGSGTVKKAVNYSISGPSAQTVYSTHYFDYSDGSVTNASRGAYISGLGLSTFTVYYNGMTHPDDYEWHSIIEGNWGYYVSVGGHNIGMSATLGLMAICSPS